MASKNVETMRAKHEAWNRRDFGFYVQHMADDIVFFDHGEDTTGRGKEEMTKFLQSRAAPCSDARITNLQYIDAGDTVVTHWIYEGTNDHPGPHGELATGRRLSFAVCEICQFDKEGRVTSATYFYNTYSIFVQLGLAPPLGTAAAAAQR
jgi:steroid delta-isomerase-like uncharacterized protein